MKIKVTQNDKSVKTVTFSEIARKSVLAKYNQLVSQGDILDFEIVQCQWLVLELVTTRKDN